MNMCTEFSDKLSAYIDNELPLTEINEVKEHIDSCGLCQHDFKVLQAAKGILKTLSPKAVSDEAKKRILDKVWMSTESRKKVYHLKKRDYSRYDRLRNFKGIDYRWMALAVSLLLFIFIATSDITSSPLKLYILEHQRCMDEGHRDYLCKTEHELSQKIENTMGVKAFIPPYFPEGFKFIKGDVCKIKGVTAAHMVMGNGDKILSYFQSKEKITTKGMMQTGRLENFNYAYWKKDGVYCIVVGDIDEKEIFRIASSQSLAHPSFSAPGRGESLP